MLDTMIFTGSYDFEQLFDKAVKQYAMDIIVIANNSSIDTVLNELKAKAKNHFEIIRSFLKSPKIFTILKSKYQNNSFLHIEPNFVSPYYGIVGRFDILLEYQEGNKIKRDIYELKSTNSPPERDPWPNDKIQVYCYDIILNSIYPDRVGESCIFYCSKPNNYLMPVDFNNGIHKTHDIIKTRNYLVNYEYRMATGNYKLEDIGNEIEQNLIIYPWFKKELCYNLVNAFNTKTNKVLEKYFNVFIQFIAKEQWLSKVGNNKEIEYSKFFGYSSFWKLNKEQKKSQNIIFSDLEYDESKSDFQNLIITFKRTMFSDPYYTTVFREGDSCIIYPQYYSEDEDPTKKIFLKAYIHKLGSDYISVKLLNFYPNKNYFKKHRFWFIEQEVTDNFYDKLYKSLYEFAKSTDEYKNLIFGQKRPVFDSSQHYEIHYKDDDIIKQTIEKALYCKDYFLIQGPPGTGKTSIALTQIIKHLYDYTNDNIYIMAFTNRAVDEICQNLKSNSINYIRFGKSLNNHENCFDYINDTNNLKEVASIVNNCRIFVSTVHTAYENSIFKIKEFHTAIVDEASQLIEPQLVGILSRFKRFILIGDEKQLPPIVIQDSELLQDDDLKKLHLYSISNSLFERLLINAKKKKWNDVFVTLQKQYRMHKDIADFVNKHYYDNYLTIGNPIKQENPIVIFKPEPNDQIALLLSKYRVIFIPSKLDKGKTNEYESMIIKNFVKAIIKSYNNNFSEKTLGIITPFRAQINKIRKTLFDSSIDPNILDKITIDTVERFQGSERDIILVSFSLNSHKLLNRISSLSFDGKLDRKLNVTLTRAKEHLILTGNPSVLEHSEHYKNLLQYIKEKGGFHPVTLM